MEETVAHTYSLPNRLTLEILDESRQLIGDRCYVRCVARVAVPTDLYTGTAEISRDQVAARLGDVVTFEKAMDRNFIETGEREQVFERLHRSLVDTLMPYLGMAAFPQRFILRQYQQKIRQKGVAR